MAEMRVVAVSLLAMLLAAPICFSPSWQEWEEGSN